VLPDFENYDYKHGDLQQHTCRDFFFGLWLGSKISVGVLSQSWTCNGKDAIFVKKKKS
jgi:hypothetical protein